MTQHAARIAQDHCLAPERVDAPIYGGRYRSLFEDLPPLQVDEEALHELGRPGGPCDLGVDFVDDADSHISAVWPFFGQFIAHDITADRSPLGHRADPAQVRNFRVPKANLESVYGAGPVGSPYLYSKDDPAKLLLSHMGSDVPRNHEGIALIGDPRNDVHLFTSQMAVAFIKLHNGWLIGFATTRPLSRTSSSEARRAASWHYQHVILREFLPGLVGAQLTAELLDSGPQLYRVERDPYIPFEFADAAYRYGHAQIRDRYQVNEQLRSLPGVPRSHGLRPGPARAHRRLGPSDRRRGPCAGAARQAHRLAATCPADLAAHPDFRISSRAPTMRRWPTAICSEARLSASPPVRPSRDRLGVPALSAEQVGLAERGWAGETPAVVLHPQGGRGPARRGPVGSGRRPDRR